MASHSFINSVSFVFILFFVDSLAFGPPGGDTELSNASKDCIDKQGLKNRDKLFVTKALEGYKDAQFTVNRDDRLKKIYDQCKAAGKKNNRAPSGPTTGFGGFGQYQQPMYGGNGGPISYGGSAQYNQPMYGGSVGGGSIGYGPFTGYGSPYTNQWSQPPYWNPYQHNFYG